MTDQRQRWNERYREVAESPEWVSLGEPGAPPPPIVAPGALYEVAGLLPRSGTAIDIAGGKGDAALHLAELGLDAVLVDLSDVALALAEARAEAAGLPLVTIRLDLATMDLGSVIARAVLDPAAVTLVTCFHFLDRALLASVADGLPSGAVFVAGIATVANLERHDRPPRRFLLEPGELDELVSSGSRTGSGAPRLETLHSREGWNEQGRHEAVLVVRAR